MLCAAFQNVYKMLAISSIHWLYFLMKFEIPIRIFELNLNFSNKNEYVNNKGN